MFELGLSHWSVGALTGLFAATALVIATAGTRLTRTADRLADSSGVGEALVGAVLVGGTTSLPGIVTSVVAAHEGFASLAVSNALGGIAAQTAFLALADLAHRRVNLEHAAASVENLVQAALLTTLLALPLLAYAGPPLVVGPVHLVSPVLVLGYLAGLRLIERARSQPLWQAHSTPQTRFDVPEEDAAREDAWRSLPGFVFLALLVAVAGFVVARSGIELTQRTGLSETVVGALLTAVVTSLPELVIAVAAVRRGALTLAVSGIIGGNCFDVLFMAFSDVAYIEGSIYHAIGERQVFLIALTLVLNGVLLLGLLRRQRRGPLGIGFESALVLVLYLVSMTWIARAG